MINVSNEYKNSIQENRKFVMKATITLEDNTVLEVNDEDIFQGGMSFDEAVSGMGDFQVGSAIIGKHKLTLDNSDGKFDTYEFANAEVVPFVGLELSETTEYLKKGVYIVDDYTFNGNIINLECLDNMHKFERPFSEVNVSFPITAIGLLQAISTRCGVSIATISFTNSSFTIQERPDSSALSCLDVVAYIAQLSGNFAKVNISGDLELKWYDTGAFEQADSIDGGAFDGQTTDKLYNLPEGTMESVGRNLVTGTGNAIKYQIVGGWGDYRDNSLNDSELINILEIGKAYTLNVFLDAIESEYDVRAFIRLPAEDAPYRDFGGNWILAGEKGYSTCTFVMPSDAISSQLILIRYRQSETPGQAVGYKDVKLELGSTATPWTPAPEDVDEYKSGDRADGGNFTFSETTNYDGGIFKQMDRYHHFYFFSTTPTVAIDDVVITGIQVEDTISSDDEYSVLFGTQGYVLSMSNNPLIQSKSSATTIANTIGAKIVGMRFRPFSANILSDPSIEAGDPCYISVRTSRGYNTYQSFVTVQSYTVAQSQGIECNAETLSRKNSTIYSADTKAIVQARKQAKQEISSYDLAMQQLTSLMTNSFGVFKSEEIFEDGSVIYYMHDKPTLAESQTIWKMTANTFTVSTNGGQTWNAGIDSSGNAVVSVLNAIGINAEWVRAGKLMSTNGESYFDLSNNKIKTSNAEITGGTVDIETSSEEASRIKTKYNQWTNEMRPIGMYLENTETNMSSTLQAGGLWLYEGDKNTLTISGSGGISTDGQIRAGYNIFTDGQIQAEGAIFTDDQIQAKGNIYTDNRVQAKQLAAGDSVYTEYMLSIYGGNAYISGSLSAETIIDRTPYYDGNALEELSRVKDDGNGGIDHSTLPKFAQIKISTEKAPMERDLVNKKNKSSITMNETKEDNIEQEYVEGRDIGAMVSVLTKGIQELISRNEKQDRIIEEQGNQIKQLQEKLGVD